MFIKIFLKKIGYVFLILVISFQGMASQLPDLGTLIQGRLTPQEEKRLGHQFMRVVKRHVPIVQDPLVNNYVKNLGYRLVSKTDRPSQDYHFFVVNLPGINAFSGPDGYIGINSGLVLVAQNESELASVLAHEIAHISQKHFVRFIAEQKTVKLSTIATILAAVALGFQNPSIAFGVMTASTAGGYQRMLNFSRAREKEADHIGMHILSEAGFNPRSMPLFLERLAKYDRLNETNLPELLRTHPVTESRLADAYNRSIGSSYRLVEDDLTFRLMQARLAVNLTDDINTFIRQSQLQKESTMCCSIKSKCLDCYANRIGFQYTYSLALLKTDQLLKADREINDLMEQFPSQPLFKITKANIKEKLNDDKIAQDILSSLYSNTQDDYSVGMEYASFLVRHQKFKKAVQILKPYYQKYQQDENYLRLFSHALGHSGKLAKAYQIRAEICLLIDDKGAAKEQLQMALSFAPDSVVKKQIQEKLMALNKKEVIK